MSSQVGAQQQPTATEQRRGEQKQKEQKAAEADEQQTRTQTQTQQATQQPEQTRQRTEPFHYHVHYTTSSIEKDGQRETKEKFEMKNPDMEVVAERRPGQDLYDVRVEKKTGDKPEVITQQLPPNQVREHIDQCLRETNRKLDETLRLEQPEQRRAIQGSEYIRPTGEQRALGLFERPAERQLDRTAERPLGLFDRPAERLFDRPAERHLGLFERPAERTPGLFERPLERTLGLLDRPFEGVMGRRQDVFNDPFRMYDTFDTDFRRMEDEFRRMRETMTRSFRDFERRYY